MDEIAAIYAGEPMLPCPFCGSDAHAHRFIGKQVVGWGQCDNADCRAKGPGIQADDDATSFKLIVSTWNKRAPKAG